jgi:xylose isomerase
MDAIKNSVGVWTFGPAVTRFVPPDYHHEVSGEDMVERIGHVCEGLSELLDGLEYHYPGEINENVEEILSVLKSHGMDLPVIPAGLHTEPTYKMGALINPDQKLRRQGIDECYAPLIALRNSYMRHPARNRESYGWRVDRNR